MNPEPIPSISSFVIRFIQPNPPGLPELEASPAGIFRGTIRHIQTDQEISFTRWEDAVSFIRKFVALENPTDEAHL